METKVMSFEMLGGSGARIEVLEHGLVRKSVEMRNQSEFTHLYHQYLWMKAHHQYIPEIIPKIYDCGFTEDKMFFYDMDQLYDSANLITATKLVDTVNAIIGVKFPVKNAKFDIYIDRLYSHLHFLKNRKLFNQISRVHHFIVRVNDDEISIPNIDLFDYFQILQNNRYHYEGITSNCHGDLTLGNMIGKYIIDSNHLFGEWNSWILDVSKLFQSLHHDYEEVFSDECKIEYNDPGDSFLGMMVNIDYPKNKYKTEIFEALSNKFAKEHNDILIFELSHYLRMLKYKLAISEADFVKAYVIMCILWQEVLGNKL